MLEGIPSKSLPLESNHPNFHPAPLPQQPQPVVDLMANTQQKDINTDLTRTQEALLSPMEKEIVRGKT